jgi:hypothetical protein
MKMHPYIGSGQYCYANSLAMMLGSEAPAPSDIEVLTGSPFGFELLGGRLPLFGPTPRMTSRPSRCCGSP